MFLIVFEYCDLFCILSVITYCALWNVPINTDDVHYKLLYGRACGIGNEDMPACGGYDYQKAILLCLFWEITIIEKWNSWT